LLAYSFPSFFFFSFFASEDSSYEERHAGTAAVKIDTYSPTRGKGKESHVANALVLLFGR